MKPLQRHAVVVNLVRSLDEGGSWCGATHVQKSIFFLQELLKAPLGFAFTLYRYGPYSFDLKDELAALRADDFLRLNVHDPMYGPSYEPGELSSQLEERFPKTLAEYKARIKFVADRLGDCGVADLERLATALYLRIHKRTRNSDETAKRIVSLKPHISFQAALAAAEQVREISEEASALIS